MNYDRNQKAFGQYIKNSRRKLNGSGANKMPALSQTFSNKKEKEESTQRGKGVISEIKHNLSHNKQSITERIKRRTIQQQSIIQPKYEESAQETKKIIEFNNSPLAHYNQLAATTRKEKTNDQQSQTAAHFYSYSLIGMDNDTRLKETSPFRKAHRDLKQFLKEKDKKKATQRAEKSPLQIVNEEEKPKSSNSMVKEEPIKDKGKNGLNRIQLKFHDYSHQFNLSRPNHYSTAHKRNQSDVLPNSVKSFSTFFYLKKYKYQYLQYLVQILGNLYYVRNARRFIKQISFSKQQCMLIIQPQEELTVSSTINPIESSPPPLTSPTDKQALAQYEHREDIKDTLLNEHNPPQKSQSIIMKVDAFLSEDNWSTNSKHDVYKYEHSLMKMQSIVKETKDIELNIKQFAKKFLTSLN